MFSIIFNYLKEKSTLSLSLKCYECLQKQRDDIKSNCCPIWSLMFRFFSSIKWIFFYNFCRTFGPALQHFLSDIHKKYGHSCSAFFHPSNGYSFIISVGHLVRHSNIFCRTFIRNVRLSDRSDEFRHHCHLRHLLTLNQKSHKPPFCLG